MINSKKMPLPWTAKDILQAVACEHLCGDIKKTFKKISIDSRTIGSEDLFIAIKGENFDGHDFIDRVISQGVTGVIVSTDSIVDIEELKSNNIFCLTVKDTVTALGELANFQKNRTRVSVIAITGSSGKTTTKQMTSSIFERSFNTLATKGNFNNNIGLPLTLLELNPDHRWAVVELGMNHAGEIATLARLCNPDMGIITNIGTAHMEGLGSVKAIANAKAELVQNLNPGGTAILNDDDPWSDHIESKLNRPSNIARIRYGISKDLEITAVDIRESGIETKFSLKISEKEVDIRLKVPGVFMVYNALAAAAAAATAGISIEEIKEGLENFIPEKGRMNIEKSPTGIMIIDDTYNANPDSMKAAIKTLKSLAAGNRTILVTGDMFELGPQSAEIHKEIGRFAAEQKVSAFFSTGNFAKDSANDAIGQGMEKKFVFTGTKDEICSELQKTLSSGDWVLVKGSRKMAMESVVKKLMAFAVHKQ